MINFKRRNKKISNNGSRQSGLYLKRSECLRDYRKLTHFFHSQPGNVTRRVLSISVSFVFLAAGSQVSSILWLTRKCACHPPPPMPPSLQVWGGGGGGGGGGVRVPPGSSGSVTYVGQQEIQQLRQQLQSSEQVAAESQKNILESKMIRDLRRHVLELQQQLRQRGGQRREEGKASSAAASGGSIKLRWRDGGRAPCEISGEVSAEDGSVAYFRPHRRLIGRDNEVFAYSSNNNK